MRTRHAATPVGAMVMLVLLCASARANPLPLPAGAGEFNRLIGEMAEAPTEEQREEFIAYFSEHSTYVMSRASYDVVFAHPAIFLPLVARACQPCGGKWFNDMFAADLLRETLPAERGPLVEALKRRLLPGACESGAVPFDERIAAAEVLSDYGGAELAPLLRHLMRELAGDGIDAMSGEDLDRWWYLRHALLRLEAPPGAAAVVHDGSGGFRVASDRSKLVGAFFCRWGFASDVEPLEEATAAHVLDLIESARAFQGEPEAWEPGQITIRFGDGIELYVRSLEGDVVTVWDNTRFRKREIYLESAELSDLVGSLVDLEDARTFPSLRGT